MTEVGRFGRMALAESFLTTRARLIGVVVNASGGLEEEVVAFDDISDGRGRDALQSLFPTKGIEKDFNLVFAEARMLIS